MGAGLSVPHLMVVTGLGRTSFPGQLHRHLNPSMSSLAAFKPRCAVRTWKNLTAAVSRSRGR